MGKAAERGTTREEVTFESADGRSTIHACAWWPEGLPEQDGLPAPRAVVQVVHGMSEHVRRYDEFARFLCAHGLVVCGDDHIGHGRSADAGRHGCLPARGGADALVEDEDRMRRLVAARVAPGTPHVMFGHSMGSYMTRVYLGRHGQGLAAAVICGTGTVPAATSAAGNLVARGIAAVRGEDHRSTLLDGMGAGAFSKAVPGSTGLEWLSHNEENVTAYMNDPECGAMFSAGGYASLTALTREACSAACAARVPHDLPLLYIAGDGDPVGDMGRGVRAAAKLAQDAGSVDVTCTIYEGMRHEILNERDHERVYADVWAWLDDRLARQELGRKHG